MRLFLAVAPFSLAFLLAVLCSAVAQPPCPVPVAVVGIENLPFGAGAWDLRQLNDDPVRVVKASYDARTHEVKLVLEFQRSLRLQDTEWKGPRGQSVVVDRYGNALHLSNPPWAPAGGPPPYLVRFADEDGVTIHTSRFRYDGDLIGLQGERVRFVLTMPGKEIESKTKWVAIDKLAGEY
jgi:hypothetical protein